ncbi:hypothetical protein [Parasitella parasitica]|uniref:ATP-dependent DNA helicase n=1 Tax=Parasitella parasitica TaxID=35722 RepID=A0A0B7NM21_9FUNG|nr:hypothetical protein [Parasitella parasitica]
MISKDQIETVDRTFQEILKNSVPFGGCLVVFAGDFRQVLPVISGASRSGIVSQFINTSYFCPRVAKLKLQTNMRVQQALQGNNPILADELERFARYLLHIGDGTPSTVSLPGDIPSDFISIPTEIHFKSSNLLELIRAVYADINNSSVDDQYFAGRVILTPKHKDVAVINKLILDFMPNRKITYYSRDQICDLQFRLQVPIELLNSIELGSLPRT